MTTGGGEEEGSQEWLRSTLHNRRGKLALSKSQEKLGHIFCWKSKCHDRLKNHNNTLLEVFFRLELVAFS